MDIDGAGVATMNKDNLNHSRCLIANALLKIML